MKGVWRAERKSDLEEVLRDDVISRQSITEKEAWEGSGIYLIIEGSDEALKRAGDLLAAKGVKEIEKKEAEEVFKRIKREEEDAALGMGAIFG